AFAGKYQLPALPDEVAGSPPYAFVAGGRQELRPGKDDVGDIAELVARSVNAPVQEAHAFLIALEFAADVGLHLFPECLVADDKPLGRRLAVDGLRDPACPPISGFLALERRLTAADVPDMHSELVVTLLDR